MGFEMIKDKLVISPQRIYGLIMCVHALQEVRRETLMNLLQPTAISDNQDTSKIIYRYARRYDLIRENQTSDRNVSLAVSPAVIVEYEAFRQYMQQVLLGTTDQSQNNFLLSQFAAWYAAQDDRVMEYSKADLEARFHEAMYPTATERVLAEEPGISAWRTWAEFLGWGWQLKFGRNEEARIVPDATVRIRPLLRKLLPNARVDVPFGAFIADLGADCPELDGGTLYKQCWEASRGDEERGNRVSLMVSTALRVLDKGGDIALIDRRDAADIWSLFPSQSYINRVTHIQREGTL